MPVNARPQSQRLCEIMAGLIVTTEWSVKRTMSHYDDDK